jgi:hypothetical protein
MLGWIKYSRRVRVETDALNSRQNYEVPVMGAAKNVLNVQK